jgi:predicted ATPase
VQLYRVIAPSGVRGRLEAVAAARGLTPFVGREDELRLLTNRWHRTLEGEGQAVLIVGEAGIGKSRLVHRFREQIDEIPHAWIEAASAPFFQNTAFYPIKRGRDTQSKTVFRLFYLDVEKARGDYVFETASSHHRLAKGGIVQKPRLKVIETERGVIRTTQVEHDADGKPIMEDHYLEPNLSAMQWELARSDPETYRNPDRVHVTNVNNNQAGERPSLLQVLNLLGKIPDDDPAEIERVRSSAQATP